VLGRLALGLFVACPSAGCYKQPELSESWQLDRLRILAVAAEPAEPQPGEDVDFSALLWSPDTTTPTTIWFACLPDSADEFGCEIDPDLLSELESLDPDTLTPDEIAALYEQAQAAGLIGVTPSLDPTWTAPADALDGLDDVAAQEGVSALITIQAVPPDAESADDVELAYKRVPISLAETPNHNPVFDGWSVAGEELADGATASVAAGQTVSITASLSADSTEEPYYTWYADDGEFDYTTSLWPNTTVRYTAPESGDGAQIIVTVRDRRGGMAWATLNLTSP
jgi:hypothetical protein